MMGRSIAGVGGYLPLLRLSRKAANAALKWSGLSGPREGFRAVARWDEDPVTLAVEAARVALDGAPAPDKVIFASTSAPFFERSHAAMLVDALSLSRSTVAFDVAGSRRGAVSALLMALEGTGTGLVAAGERRPTQAGSGAQLAYGDGGAACIVADKGAARLLAAASLSHDFADIYASREHPTPYAAEERFVRDVAVAELIAPVVREACRKAKIAAGEIALSAVVEPASGAYKALAGRLGLTAPNVATDLAAQAGDLGAAHPLFALALAFDRAKPSDIVLLAGFGSGCDALLFQVEREVPGARAVAEALTHGAPFSDYVRFLNLSGAVDLDWGPRSEFDQKVSAPVLERYGRDVMGFVGGRDAEGNVQFPKSRIPVSPHAHGPEPLADVRLADVPARIVSLTSDRLNYCPDPPFVFGLVQFENGARVMMEFTDLEGPPPAVGDPVATRFRVKAIDRRRGFRTYFWKAVPTARPTMEVQ